MGRYTLLTGKILNIVKVSILPKLIHRFNTTIIKIPADIFLVQIDKKMPKYIWKCKNPRMIKITLRKKIKVGSLSRLYVKSCCKVTEIKVMWYCQYDIIQQHRLKSREIQLCIYTLFISEEDEKIIQWRKDSFSTNSTRTVIYPYV